MRKLQTGKVQSGKSQQSGNTSKKSKSNVLIVIVVVILMLVTSGVIAFMLNIGNLRESVLSVFSPQDATDVEASEQETLEAQIRDEVLRLSEKESELNVRENQLHAREAELNSKEEELNRIMQENIDVREQLSPRLENILSIAKMYGDMESEQASLILSKMANPEQVILILKHLDKTKSGEILGLMVPETAAGLIERMMEQNQE